MLLSNEDAKAMLKQFNNIPMPNQGLSPQEIKQYLAYFHWIDESKVMHSDKKSGVSK
jgi:nitrite reductase (NO-forming)